MDTVQFVNATEMVISRIDKLGKATVKNIP